jgi:hypothetical protein
MPFQLGYSPVEAEVGIEPTMIRVAAGCLATWLLGLGVTEENRTPGLLGHNQTL